MQDQGGRPTRFAKKRQSALHRWLSLGICSSAVALIWLIVLPALSRGLGLQTEIHDRQIRGIDATAMFYTDLDLMDDVLKRIDQFHRTHPAALWLPNTSNSVRSE